MQSLTTYITDLKQQGFTTGQIQHACLLQAFGKTMTAAIYAFAADYMDGIVDGMPTSALEVLARYYGHKRMGNMSFETLCDKVLRMQLVITDSPDYEQIKNSVQHYIK